jgi:hypothetical protein
VTSRTAARAHPAYRRGRVASRPHRFDRDGLDHDLLALGRRRPSACGHAVAVARHGSDHPRLRPAGRSLRRGPSRHRYRGAGGDGDPGSRRWDRDVRRPGRRPGVPDDRPRRRGAEHLLLLDRGDGSSRRPRHTWASRRDDGMGPRRRIRRAPASRRAPRRQLRRSSALSRVAVGLEPDQARAARGHRRAFSGRQQCRK